MSLHLSKLRANRADSASRHYRLVGRSCVICVAFLKLFEKNLPCELDRLYQRIGDDLDALLRAVGLSVAA